MLTCFVLLALCALLKKKAPVLIFNPPFPVFRGINFNSKVFLHFYPHLWSWTYQDLSNDQ